MSFWIGIVKEVQEDNSIKFDIDGLDVFSVKPIAYPAESVTCKPETNNKVLIEQPDESIQTFIYRTLGDKNIWLKNNSVLIDISNENSCLVKFPNFEIEAKDTGVLINIGKVKITANANNVTIGGAGASLTINGTVVTGDLTGGPFLSEFGSKSLQTLFQGTPVSGKTITLL